MSQNAAPQAHTPTPSSSDLAHLLASRIQGLRQDYAEQCVSYVASHDALVAALRDVVGKFNRGGYGDAPCPFMANAEAALARVEAA